MSKEKSTLNDLSADLFILIKKTKDGMLRVANGTLITTFWEIGKTLQKNSTGNSKGATFEDPVTPLSKSLSAKYGAYFSSENLNAMIRFANYYPDLTEVRYISSVGGWEHIKTLIQQTDNKPPAKRNLDTNWTKLIQTALEQQASGKSPFADLFTEPELTSYKKLLTPGKRLKAPAEKLQPSIQLIHNLLDKFARKQNVKWNADLNLLFWEIGRLINQEANLTNIDQTHLLPELSGALTKQFGKKFGKQRLKQMCSFNKEVPDFRIATRLAYLLPFQYILKLLPVQSMHARLFYGRIAAAQGLSLSELQKKIAADEFSHTSGAKQQEEQLITHLNNPARERNISTKGNNRTGIISEYIDIGEDATRSLLITSPFRNSLFL